MLCCRHKRPSVKIALVDAFNISRQVRSVRAGDKDREMSPKRETYLESGDYKGECRGGSD